MNKKGPMRIVWLLCLGWMVNTATAQTTRHELSIQQAVEYARKNNVQVKNALLNIQMQKQTNREITAAALPNISGSVGVTDYIDIPTSLLPGEIFGQPAGTFIPVQFGTKYNSSATLQLQQTLFDGQVFVGLKARTTAIDFQTKNMEVTEEAIKTNLYKIYFQLVVSKTQIDLLDANIARLKKLESDASQMYKNGFAEKLDIDKVSVQITNLETDKIRALNSISVGYLGLKTLMGMPVHDTLVLTDKITEEQITRDFVIDTAFNYEDRKEFQYLSLAKKLNEYNVQRYKMSYVPTLSMNGAYTKNAQRNTFDFGQKGGAWFTTSYIGFNLAVPIFSGFAKSARVEKAKIELRETENQLDNLKLTISSEVEQANIQFRSATTALAAQKKNMQLAENVFNQTKKKFDAGTGSNTEISAAQTDMVTAQTNYITALYAAIIAKVDYLKATGKL
jgi:outer membrane protein